jgi:imidazolonepropionase-like amidohydrolase
LLPPKPIGNDTFTGSIEKGKLADFIILSKKLDKDNVFDEDLKVDATFKSGIRK